MLGNNVKQLNKERPVQIYAKIDGSASVSVIKSPVKLTILELLKNSDMEFDEIVTNTGRSKSTISVHLKALREDGIIDYKLNPNDNRKKVFYISSKFVGEVNHSEPKKLNENKTDYIVKNIIENDNGFEFSSLLFHTLRTTLIQEGINIDPILHEAGLKIGLSLFDQVYDEDFEQFLNNIAQFWSDNGLGKLTIEIGDIITVTSVDCFECYLLPKTGKPACFLDSGILEALMSSYFNSKVDVTEVKCYTMGDECCTFLIEPKGEVYSFVQDVSK
ncbi:MAG: V4R domain-containing protein [Methanobrevibacter sp.]